MTEFISNDPLLGVKVTRNELETLLLETGNKVIELFDKTYKTFDTKNKPVFDQSSGISSGDLFWLYMTKSTPYVWIDNGVDSHIIRQSNKPVLSFLTGGSPKTKPGSLQSFKGTMGNIRRYSKEVYHPGIKPRNFSIEIAKEASIILEDKMR